MGEALCCVPLDRSTVAVTKHFGRFNDILEPGFHCLPFSLGYQLAGIWITEDPVLCFYFDLKVSRSLKSISTCNSFSIGPHLL
ncbi:UNVERIFIED_CONTAM: Hypersensitive-induced response protein 2 [Sesamum calycinum]|uniref:Hypersensitive-induced response protein 2 n=1 Tax=Sesamum calycinum TaxID=2727403 RepID=A0AAW2QX08_9LAMI